MLETAIAAAQAAGQIIRDQYLAPRQVTQKGYRDVVTDVDVAAEAAIIGLLRQRFPDHAMISEEAGGGALGDGYTWVIDPLDGTTNYSRRLPICAVSIGLLRGREPLLGVIYDPLREQLFAAERGGGATLNGAPIQASARRELPEAVVGIDWGHEDPVRAGVLEAINRLAPLCATVRALGSATLALAYVAAGWLDAYLNLTMKPWDAAAGLVLIAEAGGRCTTPLGGPYGVEVPQCLASNGLLHAALCAALVPGSGCT